MKKPAGPMLQKLMQAYGVEQLSELAAALGQSVDTVKSWHARGRVPERYILLAAKSTGRPAEWFMENLVAPYEVSYVSSRATMARERANVTDSANSMQEPVAEYSAAFYQPVPHMGVRVSAGTGDNGVIEEFKEGEFAFRRDWMRRAFGRSGDGFAIVEVCGDSMQPALLHGDLVVVDLHVRRVDVNGVYVIRLRGDLLVKRIQRRLDGSLVVKSDNPAYDPEHIAVDSVDDLHIIGRLVWPRVR